MNDQNERNADEKWDDVLAGLLQLAERLEHEQFPGRAWVAPAGARTANADPCRLPSANGASPRRSSRGVVALTTVAAVAVLVLGVTWFSGYRWDRELPAPIEVVGEEFAMPTPLLEWELLVDSPFVNFTGSEDTIDEGTSELVVVEDFDSYSIIDFSNGSPLISYVRKNLNDMIEVVPEVVETGGG